MNEDLSLDWLLADVEARLARESERLNGEVEILSGKALRKMPRRWITAVLRTIVSATCVEPNLLRQEMAHLRAAVRGGYIWIARRIKPHHDQDTIQGIGFVGCGVLWPLDQIDRFGREVREAGTFYTFPEERYKWTKLPVCTVIYLEMVLLAHRNGWFMQSTTKTEQLIDQTERGHNAMDLVSYGELDREPVAMQRAICCCNPVETGADSVERNPDQCKYRQNNRCRWMVSWLTRARGSELAAAK